uniref:Uncharacterized protein n=1 Tax=Rhizophora mucronata TaxID=61149 RepID=A0A2P2NXQ8_RHIMU
MIPISQSVQLSDKARRIMVTMLS